MVWECLELLVLIQRKRQKKNEEMKREAELRKKYEENLDKPITITQRQFMEISAQVLTNGKFMSIAKERDPQMRAMLCINFRLSILEKIIPVRTLGKCIMFSVR